MAARDDGVPTADSDGGAPASEDLVVPLRNPGEFDEMEHAHSFNVQPADGLHLVLVSMVSRPGAQERDAPALHLNYHVGEGRTGGRGRSQQRRRTRRPLRVPPLQVQWALLSRPAVRATLDLGLAGLRRCAPSSVPSPPPPSRHAPRSVTAGPGGPEATVMVQDGREPSLQVSVLPPQQGNRMVQLAAGSRCVAGAGAAYADGSDVGQCPAGGQRPSAAARPRAAAAR